MEVRDAVQIAKAHLTKAFVEDHIINLGLEEIEFDEVQDIWRITLGFSRNWPNLNAPAPGSMSPMYEDTRKLPRDYRVISVRDRDGKPISIKMREFA